MSSYKGHSIFAVILSLVMFFNPFYIALAVIGANIPDFDHEFKRNDVLLIISIGLILSIILYLLNLPIYFGLLFVLLGIIFLLSNHRGFTHSIFGIIIIGLAIFLIVYFGMDLANIFYNSSNFSSGSNLILNGAVIPFKFLILILLLVFLALLFLNKKLSVIFSVAMVIFLVFLIFGIVPVFKLNVLKIIFSIYLGLFSHIILDSFTPSGIKPFLLVSNKKYFKKSGIILFLLLVVVYLFLFSNQMLVFNKYF